MKTIAVLSDTHGNRSAIDKISAVLQESDLVIHLGDTSQDGNYLKKYNKNVYLLNGNCDFMPVGNEELIIDVEDVKIFACHGHRYSVKSTDKKLITRAKELGCRVALYGHTHCASESETNGVLAVNPGAMTKFCRKSYCYIVIDGSTAVAKIVYID